MALVKRKQLGETADKEFGRLYVIKLVLKDGTEVHKVGTTYSDNDTAVYSVLTKILTAFYRNQGYTPQTTLLRVIKVRIPEIVGPFILNLLKGLEYRI